MRRSSGIRMVVFSIILFCLAWPWRESVAMAETVTDTFQLKLTGKEWCRDNPKFSAPFNFTAKAGFTLTITRDPLNTGDTTGLQATIGHTGIATMDAALLTGQAFRANNSGSIWELVLSGADQSHPSNFLTMRGRATRNKAGRFTKVSGTMIFRILDKIGGAQDVDCFASGTYGTGKPIEAIETIVLGTPYMHPSDIASINEAFSLTASAPWGFAHNGIDFMPGSNLAPFQAAASGTIEDVKFWQNNISGNWQVNVRIRVNNTFVMDHAFEPMSSSHNDGQTQQANIYVSVGQQVAKGEMIGKLVMVGGGAHVHFSLVQDNSFVCPEPFFTPEANASIMSLIHKDHPTWNMCY